MSNLLAKSICERPAFCLCSRSQLPACALRFAVSLPLRAVARVEGVVGIANNSPANLVPNHRSTSQTLDTHFIRDRDEDQKKLVVADDVILVPFTPCVLDQRDCTRPEPAPMFVA